MVLRLVWVDDNQGGASFWHSIEQGVVIVTHYVKGRWKNCRDV